MGPQVASLLVLLVLLGRSNPAHARVRLNAISTVILQEEQAPLENRSLWEPGLDITLSQCMSDLECAEGSYCHASTKGPAHARCQVCRRRKRRCHRDGMCCPGNHCSHNVCLPVAVAPGSDGGMSPSGRSGWRKRRRMDVRAASGQVGAPCLRSAHCSAGLCCARHFWTHICKPVLQEGQVCTRLRQRDNLELFQRCPCGDGLGCRTLREPGVHLEVKSKVKESPSGHASPHSSLLSAAPWRSAAKTRLHVCQKN